MRAARLLPGEDRLTYQDLPVPTPQPGWALLDVKAAGLCHTDLHVMEGVQFSAHNTVDYTVTRPRVLGHEVAGVVVAVGSPADERLVGMAVAVGSGETAQATPGMHIDGGFAEYCAVPVASLVPVPEGVPLEIAAVATDSIATAYSAITQAGGITTGHRVAVIGLGGLGLSAVRIAKLRGATVFGVDIDTNRFPLARDAGAVRCVSDVADLDAEDIGTVVDFVGGDTTTAALDTIQVGGRVVLVGLAAARLDISALSLVLGRKTLVGSLGSPRGNVLATVLEHIASGDIRPTVEVVPFDDLNAAYDRLRSGAVSGRLVTRPGAAPD